MCLRAPLILFLLSGVLDELSRRLYHFIHRLLGLVDHCSPSFFVNYFEVAIRDYAEDFDYHVVL